MKIQNFLKLSACGFLMSVSFSSQDAFAQVVPTQLQSSQGIVAPGRIEDRFTEEEEIPDLGARVEVERSPPLQAPPNAENITFTLRNLSIEGVSAYEGTDLAYIYQNQIGTTVSLADIYTIANRLTNKYRNEGYILTQVDVPPQTIEGGNVKLRVVEGYVDRVIVVGEDDASAMNLIKKYASNINTGEPLHIKTVEKYLLLINDLPGVSARAIFDKSNTQVGAADVRIIITRKQYDALLGIDNFGSRYLGPVQLTAAATANSIFGNNEQITGQFVSAPFGNNDPELSFGALSYEQPINSIGTSASVFLSHSDTEPGFDIDIFDVRGRSTTYGAGLEHAFIRSRNHNLYGRSQFDLRNVDSKSDIDVTRKDRIRALRVGGRYEFLDTVFGVGINALDAEVSQGFDILGASDKGDNALTRPAGDPQFTKLNVSAQRLQRITSDVNLLLGFNGQISNNALLSSEEFGVGGVNVGRAFDSSEIIGDDGYSTKVELQWRDPVKSTFSAVENYSLYSFWDFGKVWNDDATISDDDESLSSVGVGVRANLINNFEGGVAVAVPLTRDVQTMGDDDPRYYFNLSRRF